MERLQFEIDGNSFKCVECDQAITVEKIEQKPRPISCEGCGTEYRVSKSMAGGMAVTVVTESEPEVVTHSEEEVEDEWQEDPDYEGDEE